MDDVVLVSACRTAIGTAFKGSLIGVSAFDLARTVVEASVDRAGLAGDDVDDIVLGEGMYGGGGRGMAVVLDVEAA